MTDEEEDDDEKIKQSRVRKNCSGGNPKILISLKAIALAVGGSVDPSNVFLRLSLLLPSE